MKVCAVEGCEQAKTPGQGKLYCDGCRELAEAAAKVRKREQAVARTRRWRAENPERAAAVQRARYLKTAESQRARAKAWYYANPARVQAHRQKVKENPVPRVRRYGMSEADYNSMLAAQGGGCAICSGTTNQSRRFLDVDHCHATGVVRGLLCNRCNRMLACALDDPDLLRSAIGYLHSTKEAAA